MTPRPRWRWWLYCVLLWLWWRTKWEWAGNGFGWCVLPEWLADDEELRRAREEDPCNPPF